MATSQPSRAKAIATALPIPESPPVISAVRPFSRSRPVQVSSPWSGTGVMSVVRPGGCCSCSGRPPSLVALSCAVSLGP